MRAVIIRVGCIVFFSFLLRLTGQAQEIQVSSGFVKDSVQIGEPISYYLTARYPSSVMALFPDSTFKFHPFEYEGKAFFPTTTKEGVSYDSAVYTLSTFEIDLVQYLSLPVFVTTARDCTLYESARDSIRLIEQIKIPASDTTAINQLTLKSNTLYERVFTEFNTLILLIVVSVLVIAAVAGWVFFGKKIIRHFKARKLLKKYQQFSSEFSENLSKLTTDFSSERAEKTALIWKKYMESTLNIPYTKYTTREISEKFTDTPVVPSLRAIDRMIYAHENPENLDSFSELKLAAEKAYQDKVFALNSNHTKDNSISHKNSKQTLEDKPTEKQYSVEDVHSYARMIQELPCPVCQGVRQKLNATVAYKVKSIIFLTSSKKKPIIACPTCLNKKNNRAMIITALLGWWGIPWGLIKTPQYLYLNIQAKKQNNAVQPNDVLLSLTLRHIKEIEANINNAEKLKEIIKPKKSWWEF